MKKITAIFFCLLLFPIVFLAGHIIGGAELSYAQIFREKNIYEAIIKNNNSKINTNMFVYAYSEEEARNQISLNGWQVIEIKLINQKTAEKYGFATDTINSETPKEPKFDSTIQNEGKQDNYSSQPPIGADNNTKPDVEANDNNSMPQFIDNKSSSVGGANADFADNLEILPTSKDLVIQGTFYFDLGIVEPKVDNVSQAAMAKLQKDRKYIVFGHADEVAVMPDTMMYGSNYELSYKRAEFIKDMLVGQGANPDNIRTVGLGTRYPADPNAKGSSALNRRAEIYGFRTQE